MKRRLASYSVFRNKNQEQKFQSLSMHSSFVEVPMYACSPLVDVAGASMML